MAELDGREVTAEALQGLALTNYGHFTSMRVEHGRVRGLSLHLARLVRDCRTVFGTGLDPERVRYLLRHAVGGLGGVLVVRVTVFDPDLDLGRPSAAAEPSVLVTTRPAPADPVLPPLSLRTAAYLRDQPAVKHVALFGALHRRRAAQRAGFDDALFTDASGAIHEGPTWNIGFHDGTRHVWPEADVLPGVTMELLRRSGGEHVDAVLTVGQLPYMRAAFVTNTAIGVRAVAAVDDVPLPAGTELVDGLRRAYTADPGELL